MLKKYPPGGGGKKKIKEPERASMDYKEVSGGVYIDYGCTWIERIEHGVFIPTGTRSNLDDEEFQEDLRSFLEKWFGEKEHGSSQESF